VASFEYLGRNGRPEPAEDMSVHDCIAYSLLPSPT